MANVLAFLLGLSPAFRLWLGIQTALVRNSLIVLLVLPGTFIIPATFIPMSFALKLGLIEIGIAIAVVLHLSVAWRRGAVGVPLAVAVLKASSNERWARDFSARDVYEGLEAYLRFAAGMLQSWMVIGFLAIFTPGYKDPLSAVLLILAGIAAAAYRYSYGGDGRIWQTTCYLTIVGTLLFAVARLVIPDDYMAWLIEHGEKPAIWLVIVLIAGAGIMLAFHSPARSSDKKSAGKAGEKAKNLLATVVVLAFAGVIFATSVYLTVYGFTGGKGLNWGSAPAAAASVAATSFELAVPKGSNRTPAVRVAEGRTVSLRYVAGLKGHQDAAGMPEALQYARIIVEPVRGEAYPLGDWPREGGRVARATTFAMPQSGLVWVKMTPGAEAHVVSPVVFSMTIW